MGRVRRTGPIAVVIAVPAALGLGVLILASVVTDAATDHAIFHAGTALVVLSIASAIVLAWPAAGWATRLPALGLAAFAVGLIAEAFGAFGFAADNATRVRPIVVLHDIGLGLTAFGLLAAVAGLGAGSGIAAARLRGPRRAAGLGLATAVTVGGLFGVKVLVGL